jgi:hypothetical protein
MVDLESHERGRLMWMMVLLLIGILWLVMVLVISCLGRCGEGPKVVLQDSFFVLVSSDLDGYSFREQTVEKAVEKVELYLALCSLNDMLGEDEVFILYHVRRTPEIDFVSPISSFCDHPQCTDQQRCQSL